MCGNFEGFLCPIVHCLGWYFFHDMKTSDFFILFGSIHMTENSLKHGAGGHFPQKELGTRKKVRPLGYQRSKFGCDNKMHHVMKIQVCKQKYYVQLN